MPWQLQDAKQKFSQLVRQALEEGPQVVTRHGKEVVVVISAESYRKLSGSKPDFKTFLLNGPDFGELDLSRSKETARAVNL
jgi:prevent-host-death family protein